MFLRATKRIKDGKEHRYWSVVESVRTRRGVHQRQLLYLGELNDSQKSQWCSALDVLDESNDSIQQMSLFPDDRTPPPDVSNPVQIRLNQMTLRHPRQWGGRWLAMELWNQLGLDSFWEPRLPGSRKGPAGFMFFDKTTLPDFLRKIEAQYGKMNRLWIMDRGIPTEAALEQMRAEGASYLVGTPRGRLSKLEDPLISQPWKQVQSQIEVKLARDGEDLYVLTRSGGRCDKERSMRRRKLKKLWKRLTEIQGMKNQKRDALLLRLGAAREQAGKVWDLVDIDLPSPREAVPPETFRFHLNLKKLRKARRSEGTYLLRTNLTAGNPEELWKQYIVLTEIEQAFKELKNDLDIRPVYHQKDERIEAHIFVSFLSYCLQVTLKQRAKAKAPGLTPRAVLEKFKAIQMIDVHLPTTDGRNLILPRYTQPEKELQLLLHQLNLTLPDQPPPRLEELKKKM